MIIARKSSDDPGLAYQAFPPSELFDDGLAVTLRDMPACGATTREHVTNV